MKNKIVIWGTDENEKKQLLAIELVETENMVNIYQFPEAIVTEAFQNSLMNDWKNGEEVEFVEGYATLTRPLSVTDDLLPETLKVDRADVITRAKAEWHFVVLSNKLYELYHSELADIKEKVDRMESYSSAVWEEMKGFWDKVQSQVQQKNLFREQANNLRSGTNEIFDRLKAMRKVMDNKFKEESKEQVQFFNTKVEELRDKIENGKSLQPIFEELKKLQSKFSNVKFTRDDRNKVWAKIDQAFKFLKEKKYGKSGGPGGNSQTARLESRLKGLRAAIDRMKSSIDKDVRDKRNQSNQAESAFGQLEAQLREARIGMIDERIASKQEKLKDMLKTKTELEQRIEKEEKREEKAKLQAEIKAKAEEKKQEIKEQIAQTDVSPEEQAKLEAAALAIKEAKKKSTKATPVKEVPVVKAESLTKEKVETTEEAVSELVGESESDVINDIESASDDSDKEVENDDKSLSEETIGEKVEDLVDQAQDFIEDIVDKVKDVADDAKDKIEDFIEDISDRNKKDPKEEE